MNATSTQDYQHENLWSSQCTDNNSEYAAPRIDVERESLSDRIIGDYRPAAPAPVVPTQSHPNQHSRDDGDVYCVSIPTKVGSTPHPVPDRQISCASDRVQIYFTTPEREEVPMSAFYENTSNMDSDGNISATALYQNTSGLHDTGTQHSSLKSHSPRPVPAPRGDVTL